MSQHEPGRVELERRDKLGVVTLRRPGKLNALDEPMWRDLERVVAELAADPVRVLVLTGEGRAFCAGHDIHPSSPITAAMGQGMFAGDPAPVRGALTRLKGVLRGLAHLPMPTIAAINGRAYAGGLELALACDLRVLDEAASLCFSESCLGMMPDLGGTVRAIRLLGRARALDLIFTAREVRAAEALELGLVNRVAPAGESLAAALALAAEVAVNGPAALAGVKQVALALDAALDGELEEETRAAVQCILSGQPAEGINAFLARRPPRF